MKYFIKFILFFGLILMSQNILAQNAGDKLFAQGQKLQMTQTVQAQKQAITKFVSARKAYDSASKKTMCDNQISICRNNIKTITQKAKVQKKTVVVNHSQETFEEKTPEKKRDPVKLSLSVSYLEFKAAGKVSDNYEVVVSCNYEDWKYECPEWIHVSQNDNRLVVTADPNKTNGERSGLLIVFCQSEKAELRISQKCNFFKSLIKGKKKSKQ